MRALWAAPQVSLVTAMLFASRRRVQGGWRIDLVSTVRPKFAWRRGCSPRVGSAMAAMAWFDILLRGQADMQPVRTAVQGNACSVASKAKGICAPRQHLLWSTSTMLDTGINCPCKMLTESSSSRWRAKRALVG